MNDFRYNSSAILIEADTYAFYDCCYLLTYKMKASEPNLFLDSHPTTS